MKSIKERIQFAHEGGLVTRFHTRMGILRNTNAQHQHGVILLVFFLSDGMPSSNLLMMAATHDLAEQASGDMPAPFKWEMGPEFSAKFEKLETDTLSKYDLLFPLTLEERRILDLADRLDGILWCCDERAMGNRKVNFSVRRWKDYIRRTFPDDTLSPLEAEVIHAVYTTWEECCGQEGSSRFDIYEV